MRKWLKHAPTIREMVGVKTPAEIAAHFEVTLCNLYRICHRHHIKLQRAPESYKGNRYAGDKRRPQPEDSLDYRDPFERK